MRLKRDMTKAIISVSAVVDGQHIDTLVNAHRLARHSGDIFQLHADSLPFDVFKATDLRINGQPATRGSAYEAGSRGTIAEVKLTGEAAPAPADDAPLAARLLNAVSALNLLGDPALRAALPEHAIRQARATAMDVIDLLGEAATALLGKQALLRGLMDAYTAAGGEGVASLESIEAAIKLGASTDNDLRHIRVAVEQALGMQADPLLSQSVATMATELRAYKEHSKRLNDAYTEASGGRVPTTQALVEAIHRGAR